MYHVAWIQDVPSIPPPARTKAVPRAMRGQQPFQPSLYLGPPCPTWGLFLMAPLGGRVEPDGGPDPPVGLVDTNGGMAITGKSFKPVRIPPREAVGGPGAR